MGVARWSPHLTKWFGPPPSIPGLIFENLLDEAAKNSGSGVPKNKNNSDSLVILYWLVVYPLKNDGVRQLGWWHSQYMESHKGHVPNHQLWFPLAFAEREKQQLSSFLVTPPLSSVEKKRAVLTPVMMRWDGFPTLSKTISGLSEGFREKLRELALPPSVCNHFGHLLVQPPTY